MGKCLNNIPESLIKNYKWQKGFCNINYSSNRFYDPVKISVKSLTKGLLIQILSILHNKRKYY